MDILQETKFSCPECAFESKVAGYCPSCDEGYMKKLCECSSGSFATDCCEPDLDEKERAVVEEIEEELDKEFESESLEELRAKAIADEDEEDESLKDEDNY